MSDKTTDASGATEATAPSEAPGSALLSGALLKPGCRNTRTYKHMALSEHRTSAWPFAAGGRNRPPWPWSWRLRFRPRPDQPPAQPGSSTQNRKGVAVMVDQRDDDLGGWGHEWSSTTRSPEQQAHSRKTVQLNISGLAKFTDTRAPDSAARHNPPTTPRSRPPPAAPRTPPPRAPARRDCTLRRAGRLLAHPQNRPPAQPLNNIVAIARAVCGRVQHLTLNGIIALQLVQPLGGATSALARAAEVEEKQGDGERDEGKTRHPPRPWPGEDPGQQGAPHQRRPLRQSSSRAQTATAIPPSASTMKQPGRLSRYGTSGRTAPCASASTSCATSTPAAPTVAAPAAPGAFQRPAFGQHLARGRCVLGGERPSPAAGNGSPHCRAGPRSICMKPERGIEAEAEEPDLPRRPLERRGSWLDMEISNAVPSMCFDRAPAHGPVVLGAAIAAGDDQRLTQSVAQRLQLVHGLRVQLQLTGPAAGISAGLKSGQRQSWRAHCCSGRRSGSSGPPA